MISIKQDELFSSLKTIIELLRVLKTDKIITLAMNKTNLFGVLNLLHYINYLHLVWIHSA